jgi:photosystem II stability/assembly factor-like uncharacterized protein
MKVPLLGLLLLLDVALIITVVGHVNAEPPASDITATASPTPTGQNDAQIAFDYTPKDAMFLDVANDGTLVLGVRGTCKDDSGAVRVSADSGATLEPTDTGLSKILAVQAAPDGNLAVVGLDDTCSVAQVSSTDGGDTWLPDLEPTLWYPSPDDVYDVVSPQGTGSPDCTVTSLSQIDDDFARVTCADGAIRGTGDGGDEWSPLGRLDNVRVATFTSPTKAYALARYAGCAAQVFATDDAGETWKKRSCLTGDPAQAIAANDTDLIAVVGDDPELFTSDDRGTEFSAP